MKTFIGALFVILSLTQIIYAQGSVSGTVRDALNNPIDGASIRLMTHGNGGLHGHHLGQNYLAQTAVDGSFSISNVGAGSYTIIGSKIAFGYDADSLRITDGNNTSANLSLAMGRHDRDGMHDDTLIVVHITGLTSLVNGPSGAEYYIDNNGDFQGDFRLLFGPTWYEPGNGAERPSAGDSIWVTGGLLGYDYPQAVVVYNLNNLLWRAPGIGHGGFGGSGSGCSNPETPVLVEIGGWTMTQDINGITAYFLDENNDQLPDYSLAFGTPEFDPGNGANRPQAGEIIDLIGGLMPDCPSGETVIIYEIGGRFWREPGDTLALWSQLTDVDEDGTGAIPHSYLTAASYPNPFNSSAIISFELLQPQLVRASVYDILGREIAVLANGIYPAGVNLISFTEMGSSSSAVYFYRIAAGPHHTTGKMVFVK